MRTFQKAHAPHGIIPYKKIIDSVPENTQVCANCFEEVELHPLMELNEHPEGHQELKRMRSIRIG